MNILFIGQHGIPTLSREAVRERRVEALATALAAAGHRVSVTCASPFISRSLRRFNGVSLIHLFSLNPDRPGGWVHTLFELWQILRWRSDIVHLHGWRLAVLSPVAVLLNPTATFVWTADEAFRYASRFGRIIARWTAAVCDVVTVPTRQLQYSLLQQAGINTQYVPDGYEPHLLPNLPATRFGLRQGQYCITTATEARDIRWIAKAYTKAKTRKRLVVLHEPAGAWRRLFKQYPLLYFVGVAPEGRRLALSLMNQAAVVIVAGTDLPSETLLKVMDSGKTVVAAAEPQYEEILGASASLVNAGDAAGLTEALKEVVSSKRTQEFLGSRARRRAKAHFSWSRIVPEYLELYHTPMTRTVAVDSARPSFA
jgi:glycosyltransferase involved in cell wall biosynthesis